ncbi:hypothetical protein pdam_00020008 [Pocillopora damicornis]|uniref:Uncharacterized protein n=1 Tax=Pocillopora damicornis TaxID=46731 RepID=A0A3M6UWD9_POCDA|nr:hypothetical protein pdam_00020008 [Pocillopora damicornis]
MTNLSATTSSGNNAGETFRPGTTVIVNNVLTFPMMPLSNIENLLVLITYELITYLLARGVSLLGMTAISVDQFLVLHYITCGITKQCLQIEPRKYPSVFSLLALPWQYQFIGKVFVTYTWLFLFWLASPCFPFATFMIKNEPCRKFNMEVIYSFSEKYQKHSYILRCYPRELRLHKLQRAVFRTKRHILCQKPNETLPFRPINVSNYAIESLESQTGFIL